MVKRQYAGDDPLAYFIEHYGDDGKMSKSRLKKVNWDLYEILKDEGLLERALSRPAVKGLEDTIGKERSEDTKKKISLAMKGEHYSQKTEFKKGHEPWNKGKTRSEKTKDGQSKYGDDVLAYFIEHYGDRDITRTELQKENSGLYRRLLKDGLIDKAIPEKKLGGRKNKYGDDALAYFIEHYGDRDITRTELQKENSGLYSRLHKDGLMDKAIPNLWQKMRDDPLGYFFEHYGDKDITRTELQRVASGLYKRLCEAGLMGVVIPNKSDSFGSDSLRCFRFFVFKECGSKLPGRVELKKLNYSLYMRLQEDGLMDEAIPLDRQDFGDDALAYFIEHYGDRDIARSELQKKNSGLYRRLLKDGLIDKAIPAKRRSGGKKKYGDDSRAYFEEHFGGRKMTRTELGKEASGLYLRLQKEGLMDELIPIPLCRPPRDFGGDPLAYFDKHYGDRDLTRTELASEDSGLHKKLCQNGLMNQAIPKGGYTDYGDDALTYFDEYYGDRDINRSTLREEAPGLYIRLKKDGLLDKAIPAKPHQDFGDDALAYFFEHFGGRKINRTKLFRENTGLYRRLLKDGLMDDAIPEKMDKQDFGDDALTYFDAHYGGRGMTRSELQKKAAGLYGRLLNDGLMDEAIPKGDEFLAHFNKHFRDKNMSRSELKNAAPGLYFRLDERGLLDEAIPKD